jgi:geranyl-CoA carboxylase alpha subunit
MVAKLIAHAPTREQCTEQLAAALDRTVLLGVPSNRTFLARLLRHEEFRSGRQVSTAFIDQHFAGADTRLSAPDARTWALAAWLSTAGAPEAECTPAAWRGWSTGRPLPLTWRLRWHAPAAFDDAVNTAHGRVFATASGASIESAATRHALEVASAGAGTAARVTVDGESLEYRHAWSGSTLWLHTAHGDYAFDCLRREPVRSAQSLGAASEEVRATINGRVVEVLTTPGATVVTGDRLLVLEAMKMEQEIRAARPGRIAAVGVRVGDQVVPGQALVRYEGESA